MNGDFSRLTFRVGTQYQRVLVQQGRVEMDVDWNEQQAIDLHRVEAHSPDIFGSSAAHLDRAGFEVKLVGDHLGLGAGRIYVDGIPCENAIELAFSAQPQPGSGRDPLSGGWTEGDPPAYVIYLHVWQRLISALDDPLIGEVALSGPDTDTRMQTVWQLGSLDATPASFAPTPHPPSDCSVELSAWEEMVSPSTGTMNVRTLPIDEDGVPLDDLSQGGYRGLENRLYRVEVHSPGDLGEATFKWSRDNGSMVSEVREITGSTVTLAEPDFAIGQWVEVSDECTDLAGCAGQLARVVMVDPFACTITLSAPVESQFSIVSRPRLRRWDMAPGEGPGVLPVEVSSGNDGWIPLEDGVEVTFGPGTYRTGDYWMIPARVVTHAVEWPPGGPDAAPIPQPPLGIDHHYCRLAVLNAVASTGEWTVTDCRVTLQGV